MYFLPGFEAQPKAIPVCSEYPDTSEFQDIRKHADYMWYLSFLSENHPESCRHIPEHPVRWYIHPVRYPFWEIRVKHICGNIPFGIQYPVMVITISILQLYKIVIVNACPYRSRSAEIHRSTFYRTISPVVMKCAVYRSIIIGIHHQQVVCIACCIAVKVKIRMVGHIYDSRLIRFCFIADINCIIVCQFHQDFTGNVNSETFFAIRSDISQFHFLRIRLHSVKHTILESIGTAMQAMTVIILRQTDIQCCPMWIDLDWYGLRNDRCWHQNQKVCWYNPE